MPQRILDVAERLIQTRGFNGFSYADVSAAVGITKASLHYHFPSKGDLGLSLIRRYQHSFGDALDSLSASGRDTRAIDHPRKHYLTAPSAQNGGLKLVGRS